jgi:hypothetical protein
VSIVCPHCQYEYDGHDNVYGKVCIHCDGYIPPVVEPEIVRKNKQTLLIYLKQAVQLIDKKLRLSGAFKRSR